MVVPPVTLTPAFPPCGRIRRSLRGDGTQEKLAGSTGSWPACRQFALLRQTKTGPPSEPGEEAIQAGGASPEPR